jgi:hypothetical protein
MAGSSKADEGLVTGHGFSRAANATKQRLGFSPQGMLHIDFGPVPWTFLLLFFVFYLSDSKQWPSIPTDPKNSPKLPQNRCSRRGGKKQLDFAELSILRQAP